MLNSQQCPNNEVNETVSILVMNRKLSSRFALNRFRIFPQKNRRTVRHYKVVTESLIEEQLQLSFGTIESVVS